MAQNVGPILEMVTEKYLLRSEVEWAARKQAMGILDEVLAAVRKGDVRGIGAATTRNFFSPLQSIIPWASNAYSEALIERVGRHFADDFWGFWMLGGMSGGGMGFIVAPQRKQEAQDYLQQAMNEARREFQHALPYAMEPVVYDFAINQSGTLAQLLRGRDALLPGGYYAAMVPQWLRADPRSLTPATRAEMDRFGHACRGNSELGGMIEVLFDRLFPRMKGDGSEGHALASLLDEMGFDREQHERIRADLKDGRIGLAQNRLPADTIIEDVRDEDVVDATHPAELPRRFTDLGMEALAAGQVGVLTLAAGAGSRWTQGAGVVKALHPFCKLGGRHRTFMEVHLAKSQRIGRLCGTMPVHIVTTSYLTHEPISQWLQRRNDECRKMNDEFHSSFSTHHSSFPVLSPSRAVGQRLIPMVRDLRFAWEELPQKVLDEQAQKVRQSLHAALIGWASSAGEGADYLDNLPLQCLHPVGHWYEVPNLLRNGLLAELLKERPQLRYLMLHNIDTLGADLDPAILGLHISRASCLSFEVIGRRIEDRGGGLARVNGRARLVEGLAMPREADEFGLSYYNSMTTWIDIPKLLSVFALTPADLDNADKIAAAIRHLGSRMPTYITLKDVKKRWGHGQEDVHPVAQWEKLWSDMTALGDVNHSFLVVPRPRGQQLKEQAQLDGWLRDGSAAYVEALCQWG
jgi:hypothetical protein